jgi:Replication initiation factor
MRGVWGADCPPSSHKCLRTFLMKRTAVTAHIDYLTKSYHATKRPDDIVPQIGGLKIEKELGKVRMYSHGYLLKCGGYLLCNTDDKQGSLLELSGEPVAYLRDNDKLTDKKLLKILREYSDIGRQTTRIDYCWNIPSSDYNPLQTVEEYAKKEYIMNFKGKPRIRAEIDPETGKPDPRGSTVYYGADTSPNRVTVYDKAYQMGLAGEALKRVLGGLTRVEIRIREEYAGLLVSDMHKHGVERAAQSKLKNLLDFPKLKWWQMIFNEAHVELSTKGKTEAQALKFLVRTVKPFVDRNMEKDLQFREQLLAYISEWANEIARME